MIPYKDAVYDKDKHIPVIAAAMKKYHAWKSVITNKNVHPKTAAEQVGDMHYEQLGGKLKGRYTIRLSQEHRVAFTIDDETKVVAVFELAVTTPE